MWLVDVEAGMPVSKKPPRWKGKLAKQIRPKVIRPRGLAVTDAETVARANKEMEELYEQAIEKERVEKLGLLMDHYAIADKTDYRSLALALAIDHIPGFQIDPTPLELEHGNHGTVLYRKKGGRRKEWTAQRFNDLLIAVEDAKRKGFLEDREALLFIAVRQKKWAQPANHRGGRSKWIETLESRLQDAKRLKRMADIYLKELEKIAHEIMRENSGNSKSV
jgi:hypothetical protein